MSGIQIENLFKSLFCISGLLAGILQFRGVFLHKKAERLIRKQNSPEDVRKKSCASCTARLRDEDLMAFLFTIACAYFGWVVLYRSYGFLPVLAVVLLTACLCGYGTWQRLQSHLAKLTFPSEDSNRLLRKGQLLFSWGVPFLMAAEISLIMVLVFTAEELDQIIWIRQLPK